MSLMIDERPVESTRLGRNKLLAGVGATLVAGAARLWFPDEARAIHVYPPPSPCFGYGLCHACSGYTCTFAGCRSTWPDCGWFSCPSDGDGPYNHQCWTGCATDGSGNYYRCCDWVTEYCAGTTCICRGYLRAC
jgi:hypothetical protein